MPRARNLKPGFFTNEVLVDLSFETRLLFAGLWIIADREGRLEDRPKKVKMHIFPADDVDVDACLQRLHEGELIERYVVDGKRYIQIANFLKHQNPHIKEVASTVPAPGSHSANTVSVVPLTESLLPITESPSPITNPIGLGKATRKKSLTPFPEDFTVPQKEIEKLGAECPLVNLERETQKFIDHNKDEKAKDWLAKWRTWIRNQQTWSEERTQKPQKEISHAAPDIMAREFVGADHVPFDVVMPLTFCPTREKYIEIRDEWLTRNEKYKDEVADYERSRDFRERFSEAEQGDFGASSPTGRSNGNGSQENAMPVPR